MDMFRGVENTPLYPRNIPDVATFQMNARGSAVNKDDHVVVYDNTGNFGFFMGGRAWWMFKVIIFPLYLLKLRLLIATHPSMGSVDMLFQKILKFKTL